MMYLPIETSLPGDVPSIGVGAAAVARRTTHIGVGRCRLSAPQGGARRPSTSNATQRCDACRTNAASTFTPGMRRPTISTPGRAPATTRSASGMGLPVDDRPAEHQLQQMRVAHAEAHVGAAAGLELLDRPAAGRGDAAPVDRNELAEPGLRQVGEQRLLVRVVSIGRRVADPAACDISRRLTASAPRSRISADAVACRTFFRSPW